MILTNSKLGIDESSKHFGTISIFFDFGTVNNMLNKFNTTTKNLIDEVNKFDCNKIVITGTKIDEVINLDNFVNFIKYLSDNNYKISMRITSSTTIEERFLESYKDVAFSIELLGFTTPKNHWALNENSYIKISSNKINISNSEYALVDYSFLIRLKDLGFEVYICITCALDSKEQRKYYNDAIKYGFNIAIENCLNMCPTSKYIHGGMIGDAFNYINPNELEK